VQLIPLSTRWAPRKKKNKKRVQSFSDTVYNKIYVLIITFFPYMFRRLLCHLQGELVCTVITILTFCDHIRLQVLYNYFKKKFVSTWNLSVEVPV